MNDRRRSERIPVAREVLGRVKATVPARVVDVSRHGMQVEIPAALRPTVACDICLDTPEGELRVRARVQRCRARSFAPADNGERLLVYRAGMEFLEMDDETWHRFERLLGREESSPERGETPAAGGKRRRGPVRIKVNSEFIRKHLE